HPVPPPDPPSSPTRRSSDLLFQGLAQALRPLGGGVGSGCQAGMGLEQTVEVGGAEPRFARQAVQVGHLRAGFQQAAGRDDPLRLDRKSTRLNSSHVKISYAV